MNAIIDPLSDLHRDGHRLGLQSLRLKFTAWAFCIPLAVGACASTGGMEGKSDSRLLYEHCTDNSSGWRNAYNADPGFKTIVAGMRQGSDKTWNCFSVYSRSSQQEADQDAMTSCQQQFPDCYVFARGNQLEQWAQQERTAIARAEKESDSTIFTPMFAAVLGGFMQGLGASKGIYIPNPALDALTSGGTTTTASSGGDCTPMPDDCAAASARAEQMINEFPAATGIHDGSSQAYCAMLIGMEVNGFCADTYRAEGRDACADQVDQQVAAYDAQLPAVLATIDSSTAFQIRNACKWE